MVHPPTPPWLPIGYGHGHEWSTHIPFISCQSAPPPSPHSSNKAIWNFDLENTRSRSWVRSKDKSIQSAQYLIDFISLCFTSIWKQFLRYIYFEIWPWKSKGQGNGWGQSQGHVVHPVSNRCTSFFFTSIGPTIAEICPMECLTLRKHPQNFIRKLGKNRVGNRIRPKSNQIINMTRGI